MLLYVTVYFYIVVFSLFFTWVKKVNTSSTTGDHSVQVSEKSLRCCTNPITDSSPVLVLGPPALLDSLLQHTWLKWPGRYQASAELDDELIIWTIFSISKHKVKKQSKGNAYTITFHLQSLQHDPLWGVCGGVVNFLLAAIIRNEFYIPTPLSFVWRGVITLRLLYGQGFINVMSFSPSQGVLTRMCGWAEKWRPVLDLPCPHICDWKLYWRSLEEVNGGYLF